MNKSERTRLDKKRKVYSRQPHKRAQEQGNQQDNARLQVFSWTKQDIDTQQRYDITQIRENRMVRGCEPVAFDT